MADCVSLFFITLNLLAVVGCCIVVAGGGDNATPAIKRNKQSNAMNSNNNTNQLSDTIEYEFVKPAPRQPRMRRQSTTRQGTPAIRKTSSRRSHSDTIDVSVVTAAHTVSSKQTYGSNKNTPRPNRRK